MKLFKRRNGKNGRKGKRTGNVLNYRCNRKKWKLTQDSIKCGAMMRRPTKQQNTMYISYRGVNYYMTNNMVHDTIVAKFGRQIFLAFKLVRRRLLPSMVIFGKEETTLQATCL